MTINGQHTGLRYYAFWYLKG